MLLNPAEFGSRSESDIAHRLRTTPDTQMRSITSSPLSAIRAAKRDLTGLISTNPEVASLGRFAVTLRPVDISRFKTPSLRNVAVTGPYIARRGETQNPGDEQPSPIHLSRAGVQYLREKEEARDHEEEDDAALAQMDIQSGVPLRPLL